MSIHLHQISFSFSALFFSFLYIFDHKLFLLTLKQIIEGLHLYHVWKLKILTCDSTILIIIAILIIIIVYLPLNSLFEIYKISYYF